MKKNPGNLTILSLHDSLQDRLYYKADLSISLDVRHPHSEPAVFMTKEYVLILCLKGSASFVFNMGKKVVLHEKCLIFSCQTLSGNWLTSLRTRNFMFAVSPKTSSANFIFTPVSISMRNTSRPRSCA